MTTCKLTVSNNAGGGFQPDGSLVLARHAKRTHPDGRVEYGFFIRRKWRVDLAARGCPPQIDWAIEHWFEWIAEKAA